MIQEPIEAAYDHPHDLCADPVTLRDLREAASSLEAKGRISQAARLKQAAVDLRPIQPFQPRASHEAETPNDPSGPTI
jgi:hypothetical protein